MWTGDVAILYNLRERQRVGEREARQGHQNLGQKKNLLLYGNTTLFDNIRHYMLTACSYFKLDYIKHPLFFQTMDAQSQIGDAFCDCLQMQKLYLTDLSLFTKVCFPFLTI